ncbi:MAG TPA: glycosyltransferase family 2 protein [Methylotenera sp.]|nr:glycosyltransferase family 2 protein [Methylotenera sp.]
MSSRPITWIITVNYRTADLVINSLRALDSQKDALGGGQVLIVDNASGDGSAERIASAIDSEGWGSWSSIMPMSKNGGFAYGNNIGFSKAFSSADHVDYLMLLNPDSVAREGAIEHLITFMEKHPEVGIAGSRLENEDGGIECSAHRFHSPISELLEGARLGILDRFLSNYEVTPPLCDEAHRCDWVSGSSMIIRREVIDEIGLMDEGFFLYFEEVDFFQRAAKAGWQTWYVPESVVMHIEGASTGIKSTKRRPAYWYNSRRRYLVKHYGISALVMADFLWSIGRLTFFMRRFLRLGAQGELRDPKYYSFDLLWGDLKAILTGRVWKIH